MVSNKQIQNSAWQPNLRKTPRGGKRMAMRMSTKFRVPSLGILAENFFAGKLREF